MVRSVKHALYKIVHTASVTYEELLTVIAEIEGIMNSRPLTYINEDVQEVLTPGHLLIGKRIIEPNSTGAECDEELNSVRLSKRMKYIKTLTDHYWVRWKHEYLIELRNSHIEGAERPSVRIGEVVIIHDDAKRNRWRLGIVIRLLPGTDGRIRAVVLKTCKNGATYLAST